MNNGININLVRQKGGPGSGPRKGNKQSPLKERAEILGELNILEQQQDPDFDKIGSLRKRVKELNELVKQGNSWR